MNNVYTLLLAPRPQPEGAQRRAGICFVAAPRRCPRIACVAALRNCPPGARAKMQTLFIDRPLARIYLNVSKTPRISKQGERLNGLARYWRPTLPAFPQFENSRDRDGIRDRSMFRLLQPSLPVLKKHWLSNPTRAHERRSEAVRL